MKQVLVLIFLSISVLTYGQSVVADEIRLASDIALNSEDKAEEEVQKTILEKIQEFSKKTQSIMDSVNVYMNTATSYIQSAKQLYQAGEALYQSIENYERYVNYIKNSMYLSTKDKLEYIKYMYNKIEKITKLVEKIKDVTGVNSKGLSKEEKSKKEGKMKDGERIRLVSRYLSRIIMEVAGINTTFNTLLQKEQYIQQREIKNEFSRNAIFFNF